jgi:hypothetical protein
VLKCHASANSAAEIGLFVCAVSFEYYMHVTQVRQQQLVIRKTGSAQRILQCYLQTAAAHQCRVCQMNILTLFFFVVVSDLTSVLSLYHR